MELPDHCTLPCIECMLPIDIFHTNYSYTHTEEKKKMKCSISEERNSTAACHGSSEHKGDKDTFYLYADLSKDKDPSQYSNAQEITLYGRARASDSDEGSEEFYCYKFNEAQSSLIQGCLIICNCNITASLDPSLDRKSIL